MNWIKYCLLQVARFFGFNLVNENRTLINEKIQSSAEIKALHSKLEILESQTPVLEIEPDIEHKSPSNYGLGD